MLSGRTPYIEEKYKCSLLLKTCNFVTFVCRCAVAYVLLAEEEATTITEAECLFKKALSIGEN